MDLNQLLSAHQLAVMESGISQDNAANLTKAARVANYSERIQRLRDHYVSEGAGEIESWESEGGSVPDPEIVLPSGMTMRLRREYCVGPYVYSDLTLALAELERRTKSDRT